MKHPFIRLVNYARRYRIMLWQATICSILNKIFDLAPPVLIGLAVDVVVYKETSLIGRWGVVNVYHQLFWLGFISFIIWSFESVFEYTYDRLWRNLAQNMQHDLRLEAYEHLQDLELEYFEQNSTGSLLTIINDDVNQLERFLDVGANEILQLLTTVIVIIAAFFKIAPEVSWWAILPIPFILCGSIWFQGYLAPRYAKVREKVGILSTRLANNLSGITTIKSFNRELYEWKRLEEDSKEYRYSNLRAIVLSAAFTPLIRILVLIGFTATLLLGGIAVVEGKLDVGSYSVLTFMIQRLLWPLTRLGQTLDLYQRAMASTNRVMNLLDTPIAIHSGDIPLPKEKIRGEIQIKDVTFSYRDRLPVMQNLSLHIPAGQTIAIVGSTGSGKSTLVKLLLRLYEVNEGLITLDGLDIRSIFLSDLREGIGLVSQDVFLFDGTVEENIAYGKLNASREEVIAAAKIAEAHDFIVNLPQGYETIVGERGQKLSGGQRQRLAIARAVLKNPPILILDEATSAVDNETEAAIARSLARITKDRTTVAIAHRLSTIRYADCIYVMEHGQLVEKGTHEELVAFDKIYGSLWRVQTGIVH